MSEELTKFRTELDQINDKLVKLLAERKEVTDQLQKIKQELNLTAHQPDREQESLERAKHLAQELNLEPEFVEEILKIVMKETRKRQEKAFHH